MAAITFADFSGGLDRRLPITVQDASRLWILHNAYITTGKRIAKRPGLKKITDLPAGTVGLAAINGRLKIFAELGTNPVPPPQADVVYLNRPSDLPAGKSLQRIYYAQMFNGFPYVVAEYDPGAVYLGGTSEGNTGGTGGTNVPPPRDPSPGDPGTT